MNHELPQVDWQRQLFQLAPQPRARHFPIAFHGGVADLKNLCDLFDGKAAEETQLDNPALLRIDRG